MTPENMVAIEEMVAQVETLLNSFADASSRIKQRLVSEGWSEENAETFAIATVGTMATGVMSKMTAPAAQELEAIKSPPLLAFVLCALSAAVTVALLILLAQVVL